nr:PRD domain-containing protein [uncultured Anaerostipes sp.]
MKLSKNNKERVYEFITTYSLEYEHDEYPRFTTNFLSQKLNMQRTNLSSILNQLVNEGKLIKQKGRPVMYQYINLSEEAEQVFKRLIGYDQSLKDAVAGAKATILYPKGKPSILIIAQRGCGAHYFAETVFEFAVKSGVVKNREALLVFDCKAYQENPDYRQKLLFGTEDEVGILNQSEDGMLFINHIDMLPAYERRRLLSTKERGILICRTDLSVDQEIYHSLQERTDFEIKLPNLNERSMEERFQLIQSFLCDEIKNIGKNLEMDSNILSALLLYESDDNVTGLKKDIHTGCVNCYARKGSSKNKFIEILLSDFPTYVRKGLIYSKTHKEELEELVSEQYVYAFTDSTMLKKQAQKSEEKRDIYQSIDDRKKKYKKQEIEEEEIDAYVSIALKEDFQKYYNELSGKIPNRNMLENIIANKMIEHVDLFLKKAEETFQIKYDEKIMCALCLHMNSALIRNESKQRVSNEEIVQMTVSYPQEYQLAQEFILETEEVFHTRLNVDEIVFVMMFLLEERVTKKQQVVTLIAMHGDHSAQEVVKTVNILSNENNTYAFNLPLDQNMKEAYEDFKKEIIRIDQGKGIILIYDMGSLRTMAESIAAETNIDIRFVESPITLIGVACSNKASEEKGIEEIYGYLQENFKTAAYSRNYDGSNKIVVITSKSEIEAEKIQRFINENMSWNNVKIRRIVAANEGQLYSMIDSIAEEGEIVGIVGDYDPLLHQYQFIDVNQLMKSEKSNLDDYIQTQNELGKTGITETYEYLEENFKELDMAKVKVYLDDFMNKVQDLLKVRLDENKKIGLIIHIVCLLDRIRQKYTPSISFIASGVIDKNKEMVSEVKKLLGPIENEFNVYINDTEIATIITIIRE